MRYVISAIILAALPSVAQAQEDSMKDLCHPLSDLADKVNKEHSVMKSLGHDQWEFLRGVFVMNPTTPPGLPYGDSAVLVKKNGSAKDGVVFFVDDEKACTPMPVPEQMVDLLKKVGAGKNNHPGEAL